MQAKYRVHQETKHTTIAGFSLGGLAAFYATLQIPHVFGNVLSMSGSHAHQLKDGYKTKFCSFELKSPQMGGFIKNKHAK
ncbi:hypothetical protein BK751_23475 [Bacillus thuringiensis serovar galleriae]|nr:hypothetical protein BK701_21005 [Bacillus thuringiensis serovar amagiensis]OTY61561.1 hypothetical protein BK747_20460 [Bacillus thuringiensis serovar azorensis]OTY84462.1 hypothetical protein BK751_23475 [Bacillus thuringiensis serovar galleriae]OTZ63692.1 hypothetical protein BK766_02655 [Bacillus thuringiensis serovar wuhanensis]